MDFPDSIALTFITPVSSYHAAHVKLAAQSVAAQTVRCEHIVVHDSDGRGAGWARNRGLEQVTTSHVAFLDADDSIAPSFAEETLAAYAAQQPRRYIYTDWLVGDTLTEAPECAWVNKTAHIITAVMPTAWARAVNGFNEQLTGGEDTEFYLKLITRGFCGKRLARPLFTYGDGGQRSKTFVESALFESTMQSMRIQYGRTPLACCGMNEPFTEAPLNEPLSGDVLAQALWNGNRVVMGKSTGRQYPRTGNGKQIWMAVDDIDASPHMFMRVEEPPVEYTDIQDIGRRFIDAIGVSVDGTSHALPVDALAGDVAPDVSAVLLKRRK